MLICEKLMPKLFSFDIFVRSRKCFLKTKMTFLLFWEGENKTIKHKLP